MQIERETCAGLQNAIDVVFVESAPLLILYGREHSQQFPLRIYRDITRLSEGETASICFVRVPLAIHYPLGYVSVKHLSARRPDFLHYWFSSLLFSTSRGAKMTLPDVLRFCDAFELRPGLVSTREIVDAFKEVKHSYDTSCHALGFSQRLSTTEFSQPYRTPSYR